jgi:hypothetical protein
VNLADRNAEYTSTITNLKADMAKLIELGWTSVGDVEAMYSQAVSALEVVVHFNGHVLGRIHENMMLQSEAEEQRGARMRGQTQFRGL